MASHSLRAAFRQNFQCFRIRRSPQQHQQQQQQSRRRQSSGPAPEAKDKKPPKPPPLTDDPIPVPNTVAPLPFWQRLGPLTTAGQAYARSQRKRPWATQFVSTLVIYLCADISAQRMSGKDYDPKRTARSLIIGGAASIPSYTWFVWLSHHFNYSSHILSIAAKVAVNQAVFTPVNNTYFFGAQALLSGDTLAETWERVRRTVPVSCANSLRLWPAVTAFSFAYVPLEYRSVFAGVIAVGWQTYLSLLNRRAEVREDGEKEAAAAAAAMTAAPTAVDVGTQKRHVPA